MFPYFKKTILVLIVVYIVFSDKSLEWILLVGITLATVLSVYSIMNVTSLMMRLRLSDNVSENTAGLIFTFGVICTFLTRNSMFNKYIKFILNLLLISGIVLTGSRQAMLICSVIYFGWIIRIMLERKEQNRKSSVIGKLLFFAFGACIVVLLIDNGLIDTLKSTKFYLRITGSSSSTLISDNARKYLYKLGYDTFLDYPLFGCGYNTLAKYTHSTYMEVLGGTGIIGFIFFYFPFAKRIKNSVSKLKNSDINTKIAGLEKLVLILTLLVMMLFRAVHYYHISVIIIAIILIDVPKLVEENDTQKVALAGGITNNESWINPEL